jgi:hypothetical protein
MLSQLIPKRRKLIPKRRNMPAQAMTRTRQATPGAKDRVRTMIKRKSLWGAVFIKCSE